MGKTILIEGFFSGDPGSQADRGDSARTSK